MRSLAFRALAPAFALALCSAAGAAETPRVSRVILYPGGATVERDIAVNAGSQRVELACLPAGFAQDTIRVEGDADLRVGDVVVDTLEGARAEACRHGALHERIKSLQDQRADVVAERDANDLVIGYLKSSTTPADAQRPAASPDPRTLAAVGDALRRNGQDAFARQLKLNRRLEELDRTLAPLLEERRRTGGDQTRWRSVRFVAAAAKAGTVRFAYEVPRAGWTPVYRASLDTTAGTVALERQAEIAQATGEDWSNVRMSLSTSQPQRRLQGPLPDPWVLAPTPPAVMAPAPEVAMAKAYAAPAAPMAEGVPQRTRADAPLFDVSVFEGAYATSFELAGGVDLASDGQRVTVSLGRAVLPARLVARTAPRLDPHAYLVAELKRPEGVWPRGTMQMRRDGVQVGSTAWAPGDGSTWTLPFGLDDLVQVKAEGDPGFSESTGLFGGRIEKRRTATYTVRNDHRQPVRLLLVEATPVSTVEDIKVATSFTPKPTVQRWEGRDGVVAWEQELPAGASATFSAEVKVSLPKEWTVWGL